MYIRLCLYKYMYSVLQVLIGNRGWMKENQIAVSEDIERRVHSYEERGQTVVLVTIDGQPTHFPTIGSIHVLLLWAVSYASN